ncbi:FAD-binding oxidoreductase [Ectothiorhodospiraceae bacterium WFHF3C12]|nr:FAD-binding oxidoreductase [Ectothiorhodospiraceae bacterium WFHF3C12]
MTAQDARITANVGLDDETLTAFRDGLRGELLEPGYEGYDDARALWNAMYDRRPALIVRPRGAADIMQAVRFAGEHGLEIAIRGGAHNVAGNGACDNGLMLDCSAMTGIRVEPEARIAHVEPGARLGDLDRETQAHGLATPLGFISGTGVAGLTLGGGFGYLSRKHGMTVDNLRAADVVTADGRFVRASADENPELFWALRGGGGNFGIVTRFELDLHPLGPQVMAGPVVHDFEDAPAVLREVDRVMREAPDEVSCLVVLRHAPPLPFLPESVHGRMILLLAMIHTGDTADGERALAPLRAIGNPIADKVCPRPYTAFQSMLDASAAFGARNYWKAHYLPPMSGSAVDTLCDRAGRMTSRESVVGMMTLGGAIARRRADSTPYSHRDASWVLNIQARWRAAPEDDTHIGWAREAFEAMTPHATGGVYVNFLGGDEGAERLRAAFGAGTFERLASVKADWDPGNRFHLNQNIPPAG